MSAKTQAKINWYFLALAYSSLFSMGLIDNSRGPTYPNLLLDFKLGPQEGSLIFTLASLAGLFINLSSKYWLQKIGAIRGIYLSLFTMGISSLFIGLALHTHYPLFILYAFSFILGLGLSACGIAMNILVGHATPSHLRRQAFAGLHSTYGIASFIAPFLIFQATSFGLTWHNYFILLALIPLLLIIILKSIKQYDQKSITTLNNMTPPLNFISRLPFAIMFGSYVAAEVLTSSRLVFIMQDFYHYSKKDSGIMLSIFFLSLTAGRLLFTFLPSSKVRSSSLLIGSLVSSIIIFLAGIYISPWCYPFIALTMSFFFPVGMDWLNEQFKEKANFMTATAMTSIGITLMCAHYLFGIIAEHFSLITAFKMVPLLCLIALMALIYIENFSITPSRTAKS